MATKRDAPRNEAGLMKFLVRMTRIVTKEVEVYASNLYRAQSIGRSLAEKHDWTDIDNLAYSSLAEPWFPERKRTANLSDRSPTI